MPEKEKFSRRPLVSKFYPALPASVAVAMEPPSGSGNWELIRELTELRRIVHPVPPSKPAAVSERQLVPIFVAVSI
jgi:hypothetical protein